MNIFKLMNLFVGLMLNILWLAIITPFALLNVLSGFLFGDGFTIRNFFGPKNLIAHFGFGWFMADAFITRKILHPDELPVSLSMFGDIFKVRALQYPVGFKNWAISIAIFALMLFIIRIIFKAAIFMKGGKTTSVSSIMAFRRMLFKIRFKVKQISWGGSRKAYVRRRIRSFKQSPMYMSR